jgi:formylmethanofuran dehydrogenase subunit E
MEGSRMSAIIIKLRQPECHVCGKQGSKKELKRWNDQDVCPACLDALHKEFEAEEHPLPQVKMRRS